MSLSAVRKGLSVHILQEFPAVATGKPLNEDGSYLSYVQRLTLTSVSYKAS